MSGGCAEAKEGQQNNNSYACSPQQLVVVRIGIQLYHDITLFLADTFI